MRDTEIPRWQLLLLGFLCEGGLALLAWGLGWLTNHLPWETLHWQPRDAFLGVAASLPMLLVFLLMLRWPIGPLARIKQFSEEVIRPLFASCTILDLAVISVLAGVGEEMLFRGVLQAAFTQWWGPWIGIIAASVLFGAVHPITPAYVVLAAGLGVYLGYVWVASGNLLVVIVAHALYDFLALIFLMRGTSPASNPDEDLLPVQPQARQPEDGQDR